MATRSKIELGAVPHPGRKRAGGHFAPVPAFSFSAASFLHAERNFLRSLPLSPFSSACLEHSSEPGVRGFSAFFAAGALVSVLGASVLAGAVVCAETAPIANSEAMAVAVMREEIFVMEGTSD